MITYPGVFVGEIVYSRNNGMESANVGQTNIFILYYVILSGLTLHRNKQVTIEATDRLNKQ